MRATYTRQSTQGQATYTIQSISLSPFTVIFESTGVLFKAIFVLIAACLLFVLVLGGILGNSGVVLGFLCGIGATVFVAGRDFQTLMRMAGSRRSTSLQVTDDGVAIRRGSGSPVTISRQTVRRLRLANTLNANFTPEPSYIVGTGFQGAVAATSLNVRAARVSKLARDCFSVLLDYANESAVVADGLDEITAKNILDDLARDLKMR